LEPYPDVFKAGAAFAGVPFGCFAQGNVDSLGWSSTCANGQVKLTAAQWGDLVRAAYPGFTGTRPRIQLWHGTVDTTVNPANFTNEIAQWTNVLGVSGTPTTTEDNTPQATWIRTRYIDSAGVIQVEAIQETGKGHGDLVVDPNAGDAIHFLGLDGSNPVPDGGVVLSKDGAVADSAPDALVKVDAAGSAGGMTAAGGATASGGSMATGGLLATGGAGAGGAFGGVSGKGGTAAAGGVIGPGGASSKGGVVSSGGTNGTGGAVSGGSLGAGGAVASGGTANTGGSADGGSSTSLQASGGSAGSGGSTGSGANTASSGCSCALTAGTSNRFSPASLLLALGLLLVARRRRRIP
jgi:acetylxylan esterase